MFAPDPLPTVSSRDGAASDDQESSPIEPVKDRVQRHTLQINTNVSRRRLCQLMDNVFEEACCSFFNGDMETALDGFAHCLALDEYTNKKDRSFRYALEYNIGAGLHFLGEFEAAQEWYQSALEGLRASASGWLSLIFSGETVMRETLVLSRLREAEVGVLPGSGGVNSYASADTSASSSVAVNIEMDGAEEEGEEKKVRNKRATQQSGLPKPSRLPPPAGTRAPPSTPRAPAPDDAATGGAKPPLGVIGGLLVRLLGTRWAHAYEAAGTRDVEAANAEAYDPEAGGWPSHPVEGAAEDSADEDASADVAEQPGAEVAVQEEETNETVEAQETEKLEDETDLPLPPRAAATGHTGASGAHPDGGESIVSDPGAREEAVTTLKNGRGDHPKQPKRQPQPDSGGEVDEEEEEEEWDYEKSLKEMHWLLRLFAPTQQQLDLQQSVYAAGYHCRSHGTFGLCSYSL